MGILLLPRDDKERRIISFRVCDLFLDPWFLGVVVLELNCCIRRLFFALSFFSFLRFLLMVKSV